MFLLAAVSSGGSPSLANTTAEALSRDFCGQNNNFEPKQIQVGTEMISKMFLTGEVGVQASQIPQQKQLAETSVVKVIFLNLKIFKLGTQIISMMYVSK